MTRAQAKQGLLNIMRLQSDDFDKIKCPCDKCEITGTADSDALIPVAEARGIKGDACISCSKYAEWGKMFEKYNEYPDLVKSIQRVIHLTAVINSYSSALRRVQSERDEIITELIESR